MSDEYKTLLTAIASRHLGVATLETRNSDSLDFHEVSVWSVRNALHAAFLAGQYAADEGPWGRNE